MYYIAILVCSSLLYLYIHKKTLMNPKLFFIDNVIVALCASVFFTVLPFSIMVSLVFAVLSLPFLAYANIQIRFWRSPKRKVSADPMRIASPADGRVIYIKEVDEQNIPIAIKKGSRSELVELSDHALTPIPCWQIGINMTPFDVHKNCSPISGSILYSQHYSGKFLSLKSPKAVSENERHTYVIANSFSKIAVVQIASKRVKRIDAYKKVGQQIEKGEWLGMIRFGSQVDVFVPFDCILKIKIGDQLYAASSIIAVYPDKYIGR